MEADFTTWAQLETPGLFRRARLLTGDFQQAEDLVQETLAKLYVHWRRIDADQAPTAYARQTLYHLFVSDRRRRRWGERPTEVLPETSATDGGSELRLDLSSALALLNPRDRCLVVARYLDDRSVEEVATLFGRTPDWVKTTTRRALARLRATPALLTHAR